MALACAAALTIGLGENPAAGTHGTVTAVQGSAYGYWADEITLFGPTNFQADTGPTPTVALAADASNSPQSATASTGLVAYGPATLLTSDAITVTTAGSLGTSGSVTSTSDIQNVNYASTQATTGSEVFGYPPPETDPQFINFNPNNLRTRVAGTATANGSGLTGLTTITNGMLRTHAQSSTDCASLATPCGRAGDQHTHDPLNPEGVVTIPVNPTANFKVAGHLHLGSTVDYFVVVFNEQIVNPDGSLTVNPVHEYFGYKLDGGGNIVPDVAFPSGSTLTGHLRLGHVVAGVTKTPGPNAAPVATNDSYSTDYQTQLTVAPAQGVLANDTDADGGTLTAGSASDPAGGTVALGADGSFTYTPDAGFSGNDTFTYTVTDDHGATDTATVTIAVGSPPPLPIADLAISGDGPTQLPISTHKVPSSGTYVFTVTNNGPEVANAVTLSATTAGARVSLGDVTTTVGTCTKLKGKTKGVNCTFGSLADGASAEVTMVIGAPAKPGTMTVTATASTSSSDPTTPNSASVTTNYFRP